MVLQNEAADADEDLEHFEDITEENDDQAIPAPNSDEGRVAETSKGSDDDSDSSLDESASATSSSEEDTLSGADDLLGEGGFNKLEEFKSTSDHEAQNLQCQALPGGYNPRHREPAYW